MLATEVSSISQLKVWASQIGVKMRRMYVQRDTAKIHSEQTGFALNMQIYNELMFPQKVNKYSIEYMRGEHPGKIFFSYEGVKKQHWSFKDGVATYHDDDNNLVIQYELLD